MSYENGDGKTDGRIQFGPNDWQSLPTEWAERLLRELFTSQPKRFGDLLAKSAGTVQE